MTFHYVLQHDTNASYAVGWGVDVTMIIQRFILWNLCCGHNDNDTLMLH
jgi:hypothetical protein